MKCPNCGVDLVGAIAEKECPRCGYNMKTGEINKKKMEEQNRQVVEEKAESSSREAIPVESIENLDDLRDSILRSIRPKLKAPMTAVLCDNDLLSVSKSGENYKIEGYISSQNGYGALISNDFFALAKYVDGKWTILSSVIGVKTAKQNAKSFASNYIAISIFTGVMGLLGYLIISLIVG